MGAVMVYGLVLATLVGAGGWLLEWAARLLRWPVRWIWAGALVGSVAGAVWSLLPPAGPSAAPEAVSVTGPVVSSAPALPRIPAPPPLPRSLDPILAAAWVSLSVLVAAGLGRGFIRLGVERRRWREADLDGGPVRVSQAFGPAAVGLIRPVVVVPAWVLELPARDRALLVRHEREHLSAGDGWLLLGGLLVLVALPWNPVLWWQVARLRAGVELDCDRRVLRRDTDRTRYARLLLETGRRHWTAHLGVAAFARPTSLLARRIRTMTDARKARRMPALVAALAGVALLAGACRVDRPTSPELTDAVVTPQVEAATQGVLVIDARADDGIIVGTVRHAETGEPVVSAQVYLPDVQVGALTNSVGRFLILDVPAGTHRLVAEHAEVDGTTEVRVAVPTGPLPVDAEAVDRLPNPPRNAAERAALIRGIRELAEAAGAEAAGGPAPRRPATAEATGVVTGVVVDAETGEPVAGARITIPALAMGGLTNAQGRFLLMNVPAGAEVEVQVDVEGAPTVTLAPLRVAEGETARVEVSVRR